MAEKYINISPYSYAANDPIIYVDINGKDIYIINHDKRIIRVKNKILRTSLGNKLWNKYANSKTDDIYISIQKFEKNNTGALTYAYVRNYGMVDKNSNKINIKQFYKDVPYIKDFSNFDGLDVSKSKDKNIHLISLNSDNFEKDGLYGKDHFNGGAYKLFHEIDSHIKNYDGGNKEKEHKKFGLVKTHQKIKGTDSYVYKVTKNSDAWKIIMQLIKLRKNK